MTTYHVTGLKAEQALGSQLGNCFGTSSTATGRNILSGSSGGLYRIDYDNIDVNTDDYLGTRNALLVSAVADAYTEGYDILTEMAEFPETVKLFAKYYKLLRRRSTHVARRTHRKIRRRKRESDQSYYQRWQNFFDNHWMETRYGWRPLVYSSQDIYDHVRNYFQKEDEFRYTKVRKSSAETVVEGNLGPKSAYWCYPSSYNGIPQIREPYRRLNVRCRARVVCKFSRRAAGIRDGLITNPGLTLWELVPYSFVADWVVNVGDVIAAHCKPSNLDGSVMCTSFQSEDYGRIKFENLTTLYRGKYSGGQFYFNRWKYERDNKGSVPWRLSINPRLSLSKMKDLQVMIKNLKNSLFRKSK